MMPAYPQGRPAGPCPAPSPAAGEGGVLSPAPAHPARDLSRRMLIAASAAAGLATGAVATGASAASAGVRAAGPRPIDAGGAADAEPAYRLRLDPAERHQRIEGFGASGAWWAQNLGTWSSPSRNRVAQLLFSRSQGIGLSQYRYNIGGGIDESITDPWRTAETFETGPGQYDWDRDAAARWFLQAAKEHGVEDFVAFVNSPPRRLTANGHTYGDPGTSNLPTENYAEFTQYLLDVVRRFRDEEGIAFRFVSPINEPQWGWDAPGQEGCHYEPEEVRELVRIVLDGFGTSDLDTLVSAPESGEYKALYSEQDYVGLLLGDEEIASGLGELATHSYWSTDEQRVQAAERMRQHPDHHLTMTEWCEMVGGRDAGMDSALVLARTIHSDLTIAGAVAWQLWIAVSRYDYHDGLIYTDYVEPGDEESILETQKLWAMGNYSRFVRPGAERITAEVEAAQQSDGEMAAIPFVTPQITAGAAAGQRIFRVEDPAGDDHGHGAVTYPRNAVFTPGSFDLLAVEAVDAGEDVLFTLELGADLVDPWNGSPVGYDLQIFDIYVDTGAAGGFTELLPGRRARVAEGFAWDKAIWATGRTDVAPQNVAEKVPAAMRDALFVPLEDAQSVDGAALTLRVPKAFLGEIQPDWSFQVLVMGSDGNMAADSLRVREVVAEATDWSFGGGSDGHEDPNILDLLVPEGMTQAEALAYTPATRIEVFASAYVDEEEGSLVLVVINESDEVAAAELAVPHAAPTLKLTPHRTAEGEALERGEAVRLVRGGDGVARGTVRLAPRSVTTYTAPWG